MILVFRQIGTIKAILQCVGLCGKFSSIGRIFRRFYSIVAHSWQVFFFFFWHILLIRLVENGLYYNYRQTWQSRSIQYICVQFCLLREIIVFKILYFESFSPRLSHGKNQPDNSSSLKSPLLSSYQVDPCFTQIQLYYTQVLKSSLHMWLIPPQFSAILLTLPSPSIYP